MLLTSVRCESMRVSMRKSGPHKAENKTPAAAPHTDGGVPKYKHHV